MLSQQLKDLAAELSAVAWAVDGETWKKVRAIRAQLASVADQVHQLEAHFVPRTEPEGGECHVST